MRYLKIVEVKFVPAFQNFLLKMQAGITEQELKSSGLSAVTSSYLNKISVLRTVRRYVIMSRDAQNGLVVVWTCERSPPSAALVFLLVASFTNSDSGWSQTSRYLKNLATRINLS